jgi:hypothetical protein
MYDNAYLPAQSLHKAPNINPGGLCKIIYFRWEDVLLWPAVNPQTGIISTAITLKPGGVFYFCQATEKDKTFKEEQKSDSAGPFMDIMVTSALAGNTTVNTLSVQVMPFHYYGLIVYDRNGDQRMIGNEDMGARFSHGYTSGDVGSSRKRSLQWSWQHSLPAPIYKADAFTIVLSGITIQAGSLTFILRFRVGDPGAPMVGGQEILNHPAFANKNLLVLASGMGITHDDGTIDFTNSIERRYQKDFSSSQLKIVGGTVHLEIYEIYAWN